MGTLTNSGSFIFGDLNWKFWKVSFPTGIQKPDIKMQTFLIWELKKIMLLFLSEKNQNLLDIQEHCVRKLGKIWSELKLLFGVYYPFINF